MNTGQYSSIDNVSITGSNLSFDVAANDTFTVTQVLYNNNERFTDGLDFVDITEYLTGSTITLCNQETVDCTFVDIISDNNFNEMLHFITVITTENPQVDCTDCDHDVFTIFDEIGEKEAMTERILAELDIDSCATVASCEIEKFFFIELLASVTAITDILIPEISKIYNRFKSICCD